MPAVNPIPEGHHSVQPYMILPNCVEAIAFYMKAFNATQKLRMPGPDGRTAHAEIQIGDSRIMMADESPQMDAFSPAHFNGSPVSLLIYTENCDAIYNQAVAAGAVSLREPADQPYGDRMCGVRDPFGYKWFIATHIADIPDSELEKM